MNYTINFQPTDDDPIQERFDRMLCGDVFKVDLDHSAVWMKIADASGNVVRLNDGYVCTFDAKDVVHPQVIIAKVMAARS